MKLNMTILYQSYGQSYGHTRMAHNLGLEALKRGHKVTLINSGVPQPEFMFHPEIECVTIQDFELIESKIIDSGTQVLVTEFYPFGRSGLRMQMRSLFNSLKIRLPKLKIASSLREFIGRASDPNEPRKLEKHARRISHDLQNYYDLFLIHGPESLREFFDVELPHELVATKGRWCGYLTDPYLQVMSDSGLAGKEMIVGFGAEVDPRSIYEILTQNDMELDMDVTFIFSHPAQQDLLAHACRVSASSFRKSFPFDLQTAKLAVLYAGYGTVIERLLSGLPTLFISRQRDLEHERRLESLKHLPHLRIIKHEELGLDKVKSALGELKNLTRHQYAPDISFNSGEKAIVYLEELFS